MTEALAHRGPNDQGLWFHDNIGLGHRRLAIIDPEGAQQPMVGAGGTVVVTYNGEIYNFQSLRRELAAAGHEFKTRSDTEVVLRAWLAWGENCVTRFRGMFACAIVDLKRRQVFLARDHFGIKPLFYCESDRFFAFASELQSLLQIPNLDTTLDICAIDNFLQFQYIPSPRTIYREVKKLPPATTLRVGLDGSSGTPNRFWKMHFEADSSVTEEDWIDEIDRVLHESVRSHMVADVPFGAFLSGGIDSSLVVRAMSGNSSRPVTTFTIGFEDEGSSEVPYAETVSKRYGTDHHVEILRPNAIEILPDLVRHYGEPFGDCSAIPTYYISRLAAQSVPMVLSGDGGDEFFAGYGSYRRWISWLDYCDTPMWKRLGYPVAHFLHRDRYPPRQPVLESWLNFVQWIRRDERKRLWKKEFHHLIEQPLEVFERTCSEVNEHEAIQIAQTLDINTYLPFDILTKVDVASMMNSLEVRTPLVDLRVAECVSRMPPEMNFRRHENGELEGKYLFKKILKRDLPDSFVERPKSGFGIPFQSWLGPEGGIRDSVYERLSQSSSALSDYFRPASVERLLKKRNFGPIWSLLCLDEWLMQRRNR